MGELTASLAHEVNQPIAAAVTDASSCLRWLTRDHPNVEELYRRCAEVDDRISISTVYRTVKLFEDAGIIERHDFREGRARYEQIPDTHHDHLINLRTGAVVEFQSDEIERLQAEIARRLGYRLVDHRLELYAVPLDDEKAKR